MYGQLTIRDYAQCKSTDDGATWVNCLVLLDTRTNVLRLYDEDGVKEYDGKIRDCESLPRRAVWKRRHRWNAHGADGKQICIASTTAELKRNFVSALNGHPFDRLLHDIHETMDQQPNMSESEQLAWLAKRVAAYVSDPDDRTSLGSSQSEQGDVWYDSNEDDEEGPEVSLESSRLVVDKETTVDSTQQDVEGGEKPDTAVDFSGTWILTEADANMEDLMVAMGVPWAVRKVAAAANYGVGSMTQTIEQYGDEMTIHTKAFKETTMKLKVGDGPQEVESVEGKPVEITPSWGPDNALIVESVHKGKSMVIKRYIDETDNRMVLDTTIGGLNSRRWLTKKV